MELRIPFNRLASVPCTCRFLHTSIRAGVQAKPPRARRLPKLADGDKSLTLDHFLMRSKVIGLYRSFIRETKGLGDLQSRYETISWFRSDFERYRHERDLAKIKALLASGKRQLKQLSSSGMLVGSQGDKFRGTRVA